MESMEDHVHRLMLNLYRLARCRQAMFQQLLTDYGVTLHQFHLLTHIKSTGSIKVTELSARMLVSMPTASRMINALCDLGLASKKKGESDRRSTYLELTPRGEEVVEEMRGKQLGLLTRIMDDLPAADRETFLEVMEQMADDWTAALGLEGAGGTCGQ